MIGGKFQEKVFNVLNNKFLLKKLVKILINNIILKEKNLKII